MAEAMPPCASALQPDALDVRRPPSAAFFVLQRRPADTGLIFASPYAMMEENQ